MIAAFIAAFLGALSFAIHPTYMVSVLSLFVIGAGMAMLQVAINPLLRVAGGEEHFAFNSAFAQFVFGAASFLSPLLYAWRVNNLPHAAGHGPLLETMARIPPSGLPWVSIYWIFAAVAAAMTILLA